MEQYIKKSALVAEIEKRFDEYSSSILRHYDSCTEARASELGKILVILNTLEAKEVDLEKEIKEVQRKYKTIEENEGYPCTMYAGDIEWIAKYFFELGIKSKKGE